MLYKIKRYNDAVSQWSGERPCHLLTVPQNDAQIQTVGSEFLVMDDTALLLGFLKKLEA